MVVLSEYVEGSSSSPIHDHKYDVFLSFRGVDTRYGFTDHLHKALMESNISTFLDDEEIETGRHLKPELEGAIKASRASVIVLSKNYANSSWCLDELVLILEQRMTSNQIVIPIFYHVEPTHVRKQESTFGLSMAEHKQKMEAETNANKRSHLAQKIDRWIKALTEVANLKGEIANGSFRRESEFIEEIVKDIYCRLRISSRRPLPQLFGMDSSIKFITSWLKDASSHTTDVLTILGMGGIGKTSLAKYVYGLHSHEFDTSSFIEDISRKCGEKFNGLLDLQKQLCDDISKRSSIQVHDVSIYTSKIENAVARKKVFIVLDDIDSLDQLDALLGSFHLGSKIIITTKDAWVTESCALFKTNVKPRHAKHLLQGLSETESQKLLCFHAFICNDPKEGYEEVTEKLVKYCEGHPLALEVLGKSLHNRDVAYWEGCIEGLKKEIGSRISNVLRMSFDSLPSKNDQDLFKHIACFFVGMDRDITETILRACRINTRSGIPNLIDRCLLSIGWNNELKMHQLLQEIGRFIVHQESPDKPWKRSRLWCHEESFKVLKLKKGKGNLLGLALDMRMLEKEKLRASFVLKTDALSNMDNLRLLQLNYLNISGSYENFPEELRWLCMHGFPLKSMPLDYPMENLVVLDMSYSNIESFGIYESDPQRVEKRQKQLTGSCVKDKWLLGSLKILNLSFCEELCSVGGFEELPALERLIVTNCIGLLEVCESIEACVELFLIDLSYCNKLEKLPRTINMLKKVTTLLLEGCNLGESKMEIMDMDSQEMVKAKTSSSVLDAIPSDLKFFGASLPSSLVRLSLANNKFSTESFPMDFSWLFMLKDLNLDGNPIVSLPNCVRSLPRLENLSMSFCKMLTSVEHPPHTIKELTIEFNSKTLLRKVVFDPKMLPLKLSMLSDHLALSSIEIQGMVKIQPMVGVEEKVLCSLGWANLDFLNKRHVGTYFRGRGSEESEIQMYFEFGIFSTIYGGEEMPNWISCRSKGPSVSFTIPSSPNNFTGLNFCYVYTFPFPHDQFILLPMITISNITKNCTWIYNHYVYRVNVGEECVILLSHWMFGMNEMEGGDQVTITTVTEEVEQLTKECGVSFVFDDGKMDEEEKEEDVLGYYKSWNHIIGGDLSAFQATTGEYYLSSRRHLWHGGSGVVPFYRDVVKKDSPRYKEKKGSFTALCRR